MPRRWDLPVASGDCQMLVICAIGRSPRRGPRLLPTTAFSFTGLRAGDDFASIFDFLEHRFKLFALKRAEKLAGLLRTRVTGGSSARANRQWTGRRVSKTCG